MNSKKLLDLIDEIMLGNESAYVEARMAIIKETREASLPDPKPVPGKAATKPRKRRKPSRSRALAWDTACEQCGAGAKEPCVSLDGGGRVLAYMHPARSGGHGGFPNGAPDAKQV